MVYVDDTLRLCRIDTRGRHRVVACGARRQPSMPPNGGGSGEDVGADQRGGLDGGCTRVHAKLLEHVLYVTVDGFR